MKKLLYLVAATGSLFLLSTQPCRSDTSLRCGSAFVSIGDTMYKVRQLCGEPTSQQTVGERTTYEILGHEQLKVKDTNYLVEWIYEKDGGLYILTFEGSRLVKKEYSK